MRPNLGILAAIILTPVGHVPFYTLGAQGAVNLTVSSDEARYGLVPSTEGGHFTISLGATRGKSALTLSMAGGQLPGLGTYAVRPLEERVANQPQFEALFVAGAPEHPLGVFRAESGKVTITRSEAGRISGEFELQARGFVASYPEKEDQWVTVRGKFEASGDTEVVALD
jgi:hypothetical protein